MRRKNRTGHKEKIKMNTLYAKTVLYAYSESEALLEQIDGLIVKKALSSFSDFSPAVDQCNAVIEYMEQKKVLIDLAVKVEKILSGFSKDELDCIDYKYLRKKPKDYFVDFDSSSRSYFRKQVKIASKFADKLERQGIDDKYFETKCLRIDFFKALLRHVKEREELSLKNRPKCVNKIKPVSSLDGTKSVESEREKVRHSA